MFNNVEEESEYWRNLWEREGTGDRCASWLEEIEEICHSKEGTPTDRGGLELGSGGCSKSTSHEEELECARPRSLSEFLVEGRGISTCGCGNCIPGDFKH